MWQCGIIFVFLMVAEIENSSIPPYIKPCSRTKDFKTCAVKHGNDALPFLLKGDENLKIPNLLPLTFPKVDLSAGPNLKIQLTDVELHGLDTVSLVDLDIDFAKQTAYLVLDAKHVELIGTYEIDGKILVLPIKGSGRIHLSVDNGHFKYMFSYKIEKKADGKEYSIIQDDDKMEYKIEKAHFQLDNLFNGNKAIGDNVNKFLNENDQDVIKELGAAVEGTISAVAKIVGGGVLGTIPNHELFLD